MQLDRLEHEPGGTERAGLTLWTSGTGWTRRAARTGHSALTLRARGSRCTWRPRRPDRTVLPIDAVDAVGTIDTG